MDEWGFGYAIDNDTKLEYRRKLGSGGFSTVHEIYDIPGQRSFARKLLHIPSVDQRSIRKEVEAIKKLCGLDTHVNIIQVLNHGHLSNPIFYFIDMELCDLNLHDYIHGPTPPNLSGSVPYFSRGDRVESSLQIWTVMSQIASGVEYIHRQHQVHRDIKPANVLYSLNSSAWKLADFGLSCEGSSKTNRPTQYGRGTPGYRTPELLESDGDPTFSNKVDIWAMGCILYELATQKRAFKNDWEVFQYREFLGNTVEVVLGDTFDVHSTANIAKLVMDMLQIEPSARSSASQLSNEFVESRRLCRLAELSRHGHVQLSDSKTNLSTPSTVTNELESLSPGPQYRQRRRDELEVPQKVLRQFPPSLASQSAIEDKGIQEAIEQLDRQAKAGLGLDADILRDTLQTPAKHGHEADVRSLLEKGADLHGKGEEYDNALFAAVANRHEAVIRLLLEKGANINVVGERCITALHIASIHGWEEVVRLLLDEGAEVNAKTETLETPLHNAAAFGRDAVVRILLEKGADVNALATTCETPLLFASRFGHEAVIRTLLEMGADVNAMKINFETSLHHASAFGSEPVVQLLLEKGAEVNVVTNMGETPLFYASLEGYPAVARLLLENGADVVVHGEQRNPLKAASRNGHEAVVRLLLAKGADVNFWRPSTGDALQQASSQGHIALVGLLLQNGANVNAAGGINGDALQQASTNGREDVVRLLLENGANVNYQGSFIGNAPGQLYHNALEAALGHGHGAVVQLLLKYGGVSRPEFYVSVPLREY